MTTTLVRVSTINAALTEVEASPEQAAALDWLYAKDVENAAKEDEKIRKAAGKLLKSLIGAGGKVTVNKGGFRTYELAVTPVTGRVSGEKALAALVAAGKVTAEDAADALEASRGEDYENIALKAVKV